MISGHFATALIAKTHAPQGSIWLYLLASQLLDILMFGFVVAGIESLDLGTSFIPKLGSAVTDMRYTHDLIPVLIWTLSVFLAVYFFLKDKKVASWCAILVIFHEICDLVTGYPHNVMGPESKEIGYQLWINSPYLGTAIEVILGLICITWFIKHHKVNLVSKITLTACLCLTPILLLPMVLM